nr:MAG TPA: hypothetical protein [Caudoviricetes sp.]
MKFSTTKRLVTKRPPSLCFIRHVILIKKNESFIITCVPIWCECS